jgi:hypothetical protein
MATIPLTPLDINKQEQPFVSADDALAEVIQDAVDTDDIKAEVLVSTLAAEISTKFDASSRNRQADEDRWLTAFRNYRGLYGKNIKFKENEKSRVFVKVTKTKVLAAYGQLVDVVFAGNKFPISVQPTDVPTGIANYVHPGIETGPQEVPAELIEEQKDPLDLGYEGDGQTLGPGSVLTGGLDKYKDIPLKEGPSNSPDIPQVSPAKEAARNMEKLIHDQISESNGSSEVRSSLFESSLLGTGIIKGPFNYNKTLHRWTKTEEGERDYQPETTKVPRLEFVSLWNFYPDPNANSLEEAEWVIHRHRLNRSQVRGLKNRPHFKDDKINELLIGGANYVPKDFETYIKNDEGTIIEQDRYEVLEYWGIMEAKTVREAGLELDEIVNDVDDVQINAWVSGGKILRLVANPFKPARIPYLAFPYEKNPYSIFGVGVAENMDDAQQIMNGHARMAIDNLALSGNIILDVDESALVPGQSMEVYAGKIFKRQSGMPGQAVFGTKLPNTTTENMMMFDKFRQLADESTGMPSYSHGQTGVQSTTRTAAGMSMLMGAASLSIKTVVKNLDDFLLKPLGEAFFQWNMANYKGDIEIEGDMDVKATGTNSLIQKEVRSQRLTMFLQTVQNPMIAPFVKIPVLIKELAYSMDLDPDELVNDVNQAQIMASIMQPQQPAPQGVPQEVAPQPVAMPGEEDFSGNAQQEAVL